LKFLIDGESLQQDYGSKPSLDVTSDEDPEQSAHPSDHRPSLHYDKNSNFDTEKNNPSLDSIRNDSDFVYYDPATANSAFIHIPESNRKTSKLFTNQTETNNGLKRPKSPIKIFQKFLNQVSDLDPNGAK
jgi:hypothetical protein